MLPHKRNLLSESLIPGLRLFLLAICMVFGLPCQAQVVRAYGKSIDLSVGSNDQPKCSYVDSAGNLYVGSVAQSGSNTQLFFQKFDVYGALIWSRSIEAYDAVESTLYAICADGNGSLIATGSVNHASGGSVSDDWMTVKYSSSGDLVWVRWFGGNAQQLDRPGAVFADASGNVRVLGLVSAISGAPPALVAYIQLVEYGPTGNMLNSKQVDSDIYTEQMLFNKDGYSIVSNEGNFNAYGGGFEIVDPSGNIVLNVFHPNDQVNYYTDYVAIDAFGNFYDCTEQLQHGNTDVYNVTTTCYKENGTLLWTRTDSSLGKVSGFAAGDTRHAFFGYDSGGPRLRSLGLNLFGNHVVTNFDVSAQKGLLTASGANVAVDTALGTGGQNDPEHFALSLLNSSGGIAWTTTYDAPTGGSARAPFAIYNGTAVYLAGYDNVSGGSWDDLILKYITGLAISAVTIPSAYTVGGATVQATLTLNGPAPAGGLTAQVASNYPGIAGVTSPVTVPQGATYVKFNVLTNPVDSDTSVTISAKSAGVYRWTSIILHAAVLSSVNLDASSVKGGGTVAGHANLDSPTGLSGRTISLVSSSPSVASVPAQVFIPSGNSTIGFTVTTKTVSSSTSVKITAKSGKSQVMTTVTVNP